MPREDFPGGVRTPIDIRVPLVGVLDQAGAISLLVSYPISFKARLERAEFLPDVTGAGAGATQALVVRKGAAAGTALVTVTPTLATHVLGGAGIRTDVAATIGDDAFFKDGDTLSITKSAGTVFSAAGGTLRLIFFQKPQGRL